MQQSQSENEDNLAAQSKTQITAGDIQNQSEINTEITDSNFGEFQSCVASETNLVSASEPEMNSFTANADSDKASQSEGNDSACGSSKNTEHTVEEVKDKKKEKQPTKEERLGEI